MPIHIIEELNHAVADLQKVSDKIQSADWMILYGFAEGKDLQTEMPTLPGLGSVRKHMIDKCFVGVLDGPSQGIPQLLCADLGASIAVSRYFAWETVKYSCAVIKEEY